LDLSPFRARFVPAANKYWAAREGEQFFLVRVSVIHLEAEINVGIVAFPQVFVVAQVETVRSMIERRQGAFCKGKTYWSRCRELHLMVLTPDIMILLLPSTFLQS
jgi:hypothetical protein